MASRYFDGSLGCLLSPALDEPAAQLSPSSNSRTILYSLLSLLLLSSVAFSKQYPCVMAKIKRFLGAVKHLFLPLSAKSELHFFSKTLKESAAHLFLLADAR